MMDDYKGFEIGPDPDYWGMIAVRPWGSVSLNGTRYFNTEDEARRWVDDGAEGSAEGQGELF